METNLRPKTANLQSETASQTGRVSEAAGRDWDGMRSVQGSLPYR